MNWKQNTAIQYRDEDYKKYDFVRQEIRFFINKNLIVSEIKRRWTDNDVWVELTSARFDGADLLLEELTSLQKNDYKVVAWYHPKEKCDNGLAERLVDVMKEAERRYKTENQEGAIEAHKT